MEHALHYTKMETPIGPVIACAGNMGLSLLEFYDEATPVVKLSAIEKELKLSLANGPNAYLEQAEKELKEYFSGRRKIFELPLQLYGTDFQKQAWQALQAIPYGTTRSYMQQTLSFTGATSIRAVANANGKNRIAIIIPCHRVIGANGALTGYAGGIWRKKHLLELEAVARQGRLL